MLQSQSRFSFSFSCLACVESYTISNRLVLDLLAGRREQAEGMSVVDGASGLSPPHSSSGSIHGIPCLHQSPPLESISFRFPPGDQFQARHAFLAALLSGMQILGPPARRRLRNRRNDISFWLILLPQLPSPRACWYYIGWSSLCGIAFKMRNIIIKGWLWLALFFRGYCAPKIALMTWRHHFFYSCARTWQLCVRDFLFGLSRRGIQDLLPV